MAIDHFCNIDSRTLLDCCILKLAMLISNPSHRHNLQRYHHLRLYDPEPLIQEALVEAEQKAYENRLEDKDLEELDALEDEEDEEFLEQYRYAQRAFLSHCIYVTGFNKRKKS